MLFHEDKLKTSKRTDFGLLKLKKYPMPDKSHTMAAIRMFNHVDEENEKELATNIKSKMKEYNIPSDTVGENNRLSKYLDEDATVNDIIGCTLAHIQGKDIDIILSEEGHIESLNEVVRLEEDAVSDAALRAKFAQMFTAVLLQFTAWWIVTKLTKMSFKKLSLIKIRKTLKNEKIYNFLKDHIDRVYEKHPNYKPVTESQFKKVGMFQYTASKFRNKTNKQIKTYICKEFLDAVTDIHVLPNMITALMGTGIGIPMFTSLVLIGRPLKMLASYLGFSLEVGSVATQILVFEGKCVNIGLDIAPGGFRIVNLKLYSWREPDHVLIETDLPKPPEKLYTPTKGEIKEFFEKYSSTNLEDIKKNIGKLMDNNATD